MYKFYFGIVALILEIKLLFYSYPPFELALSAQPFSLYRYKYVYMQICAYFASDRA